MSLVRLDDSHIERFELTANPTRTFVSSSKTGVTGSVALFVDNSKTIRDVLVTGKNSGFFTDNSIEGARGYADDRVTSASLGTVTGADSLKAVKGYLNIVNVTTQSVRANKRQEVIRSKPGARLNKNFMKKGVIQNSLFPYYKHKYPTCDWAFTNYSSINFVTGAGLPANSVMIYPAGTGTVAQQNVNFLAPSSSFTFDFWLNPRYTVIDEGAPFTAGTILHMSSCYAISLMTGSSVDPTGKPDGFRLLLQLSQSAEIPPSQIAVNGSIVTTSGSAADTGFIFASSDNSLRKNHWHHVAVRWGGLTFQGGTGSFVIDGGENSRFEISSASVMQPSLPVGTSGDPDALFIGNFYEGTNTGADQIASFFNTTAATQEGVQVFNQNLSSDPTTYTFRHPLNAEIHDVKIYNSYRSLKQIRTGLATGSKLEKDLLFYVPPFFTKESRRRNVLQTPFFDAAGRTEDPFNVALSFGLGGLSINLENYLRDFVRGKFPRLLNLSSSRCDTTFQEEGRDSNYILYSLSETHRKRNLTILPCDNGRHFPNFDLLASGTQEPFPTSGSAEDRFVDFYGTRNTQLVSLANMVDVSKRTLKADEKEANLVSTSSVFQELLSGDPENVDPAVSPGNILTILHRTKDPSSNEIAIFDISNLFYGDRINPGTLVLKDASVTGSFGRVAVTVKDDGKGSLYRADSLTEPAKWSNVGNVLYEEGLVIIKTPNFPLFGKDGFEVSFEGERQVYVLEITVPAERSALNESKNPSYVKLKPTDYDSELADRFSYLTGMQLHDENLNVIGRVNFAQPVIKRDEDRLVIRARLDF